MEDLFSSNIKARIAIHIATSSIVILVKSMWINGILNYDVLVPIKEEKKETVFCHATYSDEDIIITDEFIED